MTAQINSIQYLRGVAALSVAIHHAQGLMRSAHEIIPDFVSLFGVYLFFAISGFLMIHVTAMREQSSGAFMRARMARIVPLYWLVTFGVAIGIAIMPGLFRTNELSTKHLVLSLLFLPHTTVTAPESTMQMAFVGWTLNYEMFFYALFALCMAVSFRFRGALTIVALMTLVLIFRLVPADRVVAFYGEPIMLQFAAGIGLAALFRRSNLALPLWALARF